MKSVLIALLFLLFSDSVFAKAFTPQNTAATLFAVDTSKSCHLLGEKVPLGYLALAGLHVESWTIVNSADKSIRRIEFMLVDAQGNSAGSISYSCLVAYP